MTKDLQQIKDKYAKGDNFYNWDDLFSCCAMYDYGRLEWAIDEVAIRYAKEQKRELLEMLVMINEGIHTMYFTQLEGLHNEIESLITKHKQS